MRRNEDDIYALHLIQGLLDGPYLPFTNSALRPFCLAYIFNDIIVNARENILEFGSGISTILMGRLIKKNNTGARVLSIEHHAEWAQAVQAAIRSEGLEDIVRIVHAPLRPCSFAIDANTWYDMDVCNSVFPAQPFDLVIIDGPPAYEAPKKTARYPALPFIYEKLADRFGVFLDDADREGEQAILKRWEAALAVQFRIAGGSLAYACRGNNFNQEIF